MGNYIDDSLLLSKGGIVSDFGEVTHPMGRKEHRCEWCYGPIPKGEKHARFVGKWQGEFQNWRMHNECLDASEDIRNDGFEPGSGDAPARIWKIINERALGQKV